MILVAPEGIQGLIKLAKGLGSLLCSNLMNAIVAIDLAAAGMALAGCLTQVHTAGQYSVIDVRAPMASRFCRVAVGEGCITRKGDFQIETCLAMRHSRSQRSIGRAWPLRVTWMSYAVDHAACPAWRR